MDTELIDLLVELRKDKKLRSSLQRIVRAHQDVDDIFSEITIKLISSPPIIKDNNKKYSYIKRALYNEAKKRKIDFINCQIKDSDLIFKIMGHDVFATMFDFFDKESTYKKLDEALEYLTDKQKHAINDLLNVDNDTFYYYNDHFKGENKNTIRSHRRAAIFKLKDYFSVADKTVNDKYLNIFNDHKSGKIKNLKKYLKDNNIYYGTYYANIKHLIPKERKIKINTLTTIQQRAIDINKHVKFNNLNEKKYVESLGINFNTYKHTLLHARKKNAVRV